MTDDLLLQSPDGKAQALGPGEYWVLDEGNKVVFVDDPHRSGALGSVDSRAFNAMLGWRKVAFLSW